MGAENDNSQITRRDFLQKAALLTVAASSIPAMAKAVETVTGVSLSKGEKKMTVIRTFTPINYERLLGIPGFSDTLLKNHFTLYQGYVKNSNTLADVLTGMLKEGKGGSPEYAELKRRFAWEFNGMRLHELYFDNMAKAGASLMLASHDLAHAINDQFGSYDAWQKDFVATGSMRGIGWVILAFDPLSHRFFNVWINEHDSGHLAGAVPLLVMDVFEHAYVLDYGLKKIDYIDAFLKSIDWTAVSKRFSAGR